MAIEICLGEGNLTKATCFFDSTAMFDGWFTSVDIFNCFAVLGLLAIIILLILKIRRKYMESDKND